MDSRTLLDYALFQLTPTRTRCDLVVFSGGNSEKLASGLVEPFISHLKFAKDQIPKGGYSITLRPPAATDAFWFTKYTFQRVVRFINTPEILERFVRIEREISQIESSVQSNEVSNTTIVVHAEGSSPTVHGITKKSTDSKTFKGEVGGNDVAQEENSKVRLQRLLETRKALLRKEQAMAYARTTAAGFEMDNMDDLILFADTFGASRLREACTEFKELCKKKHSDDLWMDELAAMQACSPSELPYQGTSGIILTSEISVSTGHFVPNGLSVADSVAKEDKNLPAADGNPSTPTKVQVQMPWPNQMPQYMYNFQSPVQQIPQSQGYHFPGMHPVPPYYPGHMLWPPNMDESGQGPVRDPYHWQRKSSSKKKEKSPSVGGPETSEEEQQTESGETDSGGGSDAVRKHETTNKKHRKKSSKTVVIRNINYITSKRRNGQKDGVSNDSSSGEDDELIDEDFLKQKVDDAVGSLEKHRRSKSHNSKRNQGAIVVYESYGSPDENHENDLSVNTSEGGKRNENWDAFQNLLLKDEDSTSNGVKHQQSIDGQDEDFKLRSSDDTVPSTTIHAGDFEYGKVTVQRATATDSFVVTDRNGGNEGSDNMDDFANGENFRLSMKRTDSADAQLLISQRQDESRSDVHRTISDFAPDPSVIRKGKGDDWFIVNQSGRSENQVATIEQTMLDGDYISSMGVDHFNKETSKKIDPIDDSFMVQTRSSIDDQYNSQWRTDMSMAADLNITSQLGSGTPDVSQVKLGSHEPDDLCMVLIRELGSLSARASWTPEMDYGTEISFTKSDKKSAPVETKNEEEEKLPVDSKSTKKAVTTGSKEARSKALRSSFPNSRSDFLSKSKKASAVSRPVVQKSKLEKEEEARKRMEELLVERQKRIAERSAASGSTISASKRAPAGSNTAATSKLSSPKLQTTKSAKYNGGPAQLKK